MLPLFPRSGCLHPHALDTKFAAQGQLFSPQAPSSSSSTRPQVRSLQGAKDEVAERDASPSSTSGALQMYALHVFNWALEKVTAFLVAGYISQRMNSAMDGAEWAVEVDGK